MSTLTIISLLFFAPAMAGLLMMQFNTFINKNIKLILSFSASFLLAICLIHLLPEIFESDFKPGIFVLIGFFIQIILEYFSSGIEHGHIHHQKDKSYPFLIFVSLFIHSFMEGFPLASNAVDSLGESNVTALLTGVLIHKIPIAIVLTALLLNANFSRMIIIVSLVVFALSAPLGVLTLQYIDLNSGHEISTALTALTIGIFLHVSTVILFESSENHHFNRNKFISILLGATLALVIFGYH